MFALILSIILSAVVCAVLLPIASFWLAYFIGWLCSLAIGDVLVQGLNTLFNTTHFTEEILPICAGTVGWLGGLFSCCSIGNTKPIISNEEEEKEN